MVSKAGQNKRPKGAQAYNQPIAGLAMLPREYKRRYRQASYTSPVLSDKMASILSLASVISAELEEQIAWFQARGLLAQNKTCPACNQPMNMQQRQNVTDKYRYISH